MYASWTTDSRLLTKFCREVRLRLQSWRSDLAVAGVLCVLRGENADVAGAHLAAGCARSGADCRLVVLAAMLLKMGGYGFLRFSLPMFPDGADMFSRLFCRWRVAIVYTSLVACAGET